MAHHNKMVKIEVPLEGTVKAAASCSTINQGLKSDSHRYGPEVTQKSQHKAYPYIYIGV